MNNTVLSRVFIIGAVAMFAFAALPQAASAQPAGDISPIRMEFDKQGGTGGIWNGTVSGDVNGNLTTQLLSARPAGPILHVTFAWIIDADENSFTAVLDGTLNTITGQVEMDGTVVEGWLVGARVHEEGQLVDPATGRFQGEIVILPATAD
jgi:hypothetical protein